MMLEAKKPIIFFIYAIQQSYVPISWPVISIIPYFD